MENDNKDDEQRQLAAMRSFYDSVYHKSAKPISAVSNHLRRLARKVKIDAGQQVLDVACGVGEWLLACRERGAVPSGIDLSENAILACKKTFPEGEFHCMPAESLPFVDNRFDAVTCLGSLEHFIEPQKALAEMRRVAKADAVFLFLVPNSDFLTRKIGLFKGTYQIDAKEEVRTIEEWHGLFESAGLIVENSWRDLHVLSWRWISAGKWHLIPLRAAQALALAIWPLRWQYQIYFLCRSNGKS
ncbi:MAG: class I SAM-dependent methyltransferase [Arenimonas sp.]